MRAWLSRKRRMLAPVHPTVKRWGRKSASRRARVISDEAAPRPPPAVRARLEAGAGSPTPSIDTSGTLHLARQRAARQRYSRRSWETRAVPGHPLLATAGETGRECPGSRRSPNTSPNAVFHKEAPKSSGNRRWWTEREEEDGGGGATRLPARACADVGWRSPRNSVSLGERRLRRPNQHPGDARGMERPPPPLHRLRRRVAPRRHRYKEKESARSRRSRRPHPEEVGASGGGGQGGPARRRARRGKSTPPDQQPEPNSACPRGEHAGREGARRRSTRR